MTTCQARAPVAFTHDEKPIARAVRTESEIEVDGKLDEPVWMTAPRVTDFWQVRPDEGAPVSEPTEVRFLYDDDAIYVGAWLYDDDGQIVTRLSRRDAGIPDVDLFAVHFDSYFAQPLLSSGNYGTLKELNAPGTFQFNRFGTDVGTITPLEGGTSYDVDPDGIGPAGIAEAGNFDFGRDAGDLFGLDADNIFLVKLSYWLNP